MNTFKLQILSYVSLFMAVLLFVVAIAAPVYGDPSKPATPGKTKVEDYDGASAVIAGADDFLFGAYSKTTYEYDDYTGKNLYTDTELSRITAALASCAETLSYENCEALFVFVPSKMTVYSDKLPENVSSAASETRRYTQLVSYLDRWSGIDMLDLSEYFSSLKDKNQLFNNADDSLNEIGGYYVYNSAVKYINEIYRASQKGIKLPDTTEYLLTMNKDETHSLTKTYMNETGKTVPNNTFVMNEKFTPYEKYDLKFEGMSATQTPFAKRENGFSYPHMIVYDAGCSEASYKYFSACTSLCAFRNAVIVDETILDIVKPQYAVFIINESQIPSLPTQSSALEGGDDTRSATPAVNGTGYSDTDRFVIFGVAEEKTTVTVRGGEETVTCRTEDGTFTIEVPIKEEDESTLRIVASTDGKADSEPYKIKVSFNRDHGYKNVIIGKDGHLHINETMNDYLARNLYSRNDLDNLVGYLKNKAAQIQAVSPGTKLIYVIPPNHLTVYPETAPDWLADMRTTSESRLNQLIRAFADSDDIIFLDLPTALIKAKASSPYRLYNKTDTHWNELGAYYACCEILNEVAKDYPAAAPDSLDKFDVYTRNVAGGDMANYLGVDLNKVQEQGVYVRYKGETNSKIVKDYSMNFENRWFSEYHEFKINNDELPTMIMYRDSFSTNMMSFLAEKFSRSVFHQMWEWPSEMEFYAEMQPDYIIYELVERSLGSIN